MPSATLAPTYQHPAASAADSPELILLEQKEWRGYTGVLTALNLVRYLAKLFYSDEWQEQIDCGFSGDDLVITLYVYPLRPGVAHRLAVTAGQLSEGEWEEIQETETVTFGLEQATTLKHPASSIVSAKWLTGPYASGGVKIAPPALSVSGRELRAPVPVFGSVQLTTMVSRTAYILAIPGDEAIELLKQGWSEYAVGMPHGGLPVGLALTPPPGAEEMAQSGQECGRGFSGSVAWPEDGGPPQGQKHNKRIIYDYCSFKFKREIIS